MATGQRPPTRVATNSPPVGKTWPTTRSQGGTSHNWSRGPREQSLETGTTWCTSRQIPQSHPTSRQPRGNIPRATRQGQSGRLQAISALPTGPHTSVQKPGTRATRRFCDRRKLDKPGFRRSVPDHGDTCLLVTRRSHDSYLHYDATVSRSIRESYERPVRLLGVRHEEEGDRDLGETNDTTRED